MNYAPLIQECRQRLLNTPDTVCLERVRLVTEADARFNAEPMPVKRARTLAWFFERMSLDIETNPVFAGNLSSGPRRWMLLPEYGFAVPGQALIEDAQFAGFLDGEVVPFDLREYWRGRTVAGAGAGIGHLAVNLDRVLREGLAAIAVDAETLAAQGTATQRMYRSACAIACRAVIHWAERYAAAAQILAESMAPGIRRSALERVAAACRHVPAAPARDLFEALQTIVLVHLALHAEGQGYSVSPGRLDQVLAPYYAGAPETRDLLAAFLLKLNENALWGSHSKTQCITLGGADANGADQSNALTGLFLDACEFLRVNDPTLFLRWHDGLPRAIKEKAATLLGGGLSFPMLIGDCETTAALQTVGVSPDDAANYCVIGCNEVGVPGKLAWTSVALNEADLVRTAVLANPAAAGVNDLIAAMGSEMERRLRPELRAHRARLLQLAAQGPMPLSSALMDGCVSRGRDWLERTEYDWQNIRSAGFANAVNALAAVDTVVFREPHTTLAEVGQALTADFAGTEPLRERLQQAPKWGNNDDRADALAVAWMEARAEVLRRIEREDALPPLAMEMVVRSLHHLEGALVGATPDGRRAGTPLADSIGAVLGTASGGPTAILNSVCKAVPARYWAGGYNLNVTLPLASWGNPAMRDRLAAMIDVFFAHGGQELQINSLDPAVLREAITRPDAYGHLMVRIAGFNAFFVRLSRCEQEDILQRAVKACAAEPS